MPKQSPCGGCPPCCEQCVFDPEGVVMDATGREVASKEAYGCVRPDGGAVVIAGGRLGMMRAEQFHPVTAFGAAFLRETGNPLGAHC